MNGREELREEVKLVDLIIEDNPCGMSSEMFSILAKGLRALIKDHTDGKMSRSHVARYFGVTERTIIRWEEERGFPKPHRNGFQNLSYNVDEIVIWKKNNSV